MTLIYYSPEGKQLHEEVNELITNGKFAPKEIEKFDKKWKKFTWNNEIVGYKEYENTNLH